MKVIQERKRSFADFTGGQVEFILRDAGRGKWSEIGIEFCRGLDRAIVSLDFEEASRIGDFLGAELLRPRGLSDVYFRNVETGSVFTMRREDDHWTIELVGTNDFKVFIGRDDAVSVRDIVQAFVEAALSER